MKTTAGMPTWMFWTLCSAVAFCLLAEPIGMTARYIFLHL